MAYPELHPRANAVSKVFTWRDYNHYLALHSDDFGRQKGPGWRWDAERKKVVWDNSFEIRRWDDAGMSVMRAATFRIVP